MVKKIVLSLSLIFSFVFTAISADYVLYDVLPCVGIAGPQNPDNSGHYAASYYWAYSPSLNVFICLGLQTDAVAKSRYATVLAANVSGKAISLGYAAENANLIHNNLLHFQTPDWLRIIN